MKTTGSAISHVLKRFGLVGGVSFTQSISFTPERSISFTESTASFWAFDAIVLDAIVLDAIVLGEVVLDEMVLDDMGASPVACCARRRSTLPRPVSWIS